MVAFGEYVDDGTASAIKARDYKDATDLVAHSLRADGFDASEDGTGRGTPLVPVANTLASYEGRCQIEQTYVPVGFDTYNQTVSDVAHTLRVATDNGLQSTPHVLQPVAFHNRQDPDVSGPVTHPLGAKDNGMAVAFGLTTEQTPKFYENAAMTLT